MDQSRSDSGVITSCAMGVITVWQTVVYAIAALFILWLRLCRVRVESHNMFTSIALYPRLSVYLCLSLDLLCVLGVLAFASTQRHNKWRQRHDVNHSQQHLQGMALTHQLLVFVLALSENAPTYDNTFTTVRFRGLLQLRFEYDSSAIRARYNILRGVMCFRAIMYMSILLGCCRML